MPCAWCKKVLRKSKGPSGRESLNRNESGTSRRKLAWRPRSAIARNSNGAVLPSWHNVAKPSRNGKGVKTRNVGANWNKKSASAKRKSTRQLPTEF